MMLQIANYNYSLVYNNVRTIDIDIVIYTVTYHVTYKYNVIIKLIIIMMQIAKLLELLISFCLSNTNWPIYAMASFMYGLHNLTLYTYTPSMPCPWP